MVYQNVRGLKSKLTNLYLQSFNFSHQIIIFTETWLNNTFLNSEIFCDKFHIFRRDRITTTTGGGVLIAVSHIFPMEEIKLDLPFDIEFVAVSLKVKNIKIFITCSYIPPNSDLMIYKQHIEAIKIITSKLSPIDLIFVFGDFNLPRITWEFSTEHNYYLPTQSDDIGDEIFNHITDLYLHQINGNCNVYGKLLDLVFVNEPNECIVNRIDPVTLPEDRYHPTIEICYNLFTNNIVSENSGNNDKVYCFNRANYTELNNRLFTTNWLQLLSAPICSSYSIDKSINMFYKTMFNYMEECIPKHVPRKKSGPPWNSRQLSSLKNLKNKYFKKFKITGSSFHYGKYSVARAEYNLLNTELYKIYLGNVKRNFVQDPKSFFNFVNTKRKSTGFPKFMNYLCSESSDEVAISNMFADFFASTYSDALYDPSTVYPYKITYSQNISYSTITTSHILNCLKNAKSSPFSGPDGIPSCVLINCATALATPLSIIFNASLQCGYFPKIWKDSYIIPLFKSGNKSDVCNYRGIAKLSDIPKLFEKCLMDCLTHQVSTLLSPLQHGFRKGFSTMTNILHLTTLVNRAFTNGQHTDVIYTDFSKAFDKVNHALLLKKLDVIGFNNNFLHWIKSYLFCRTQSVKFNAAVSKKINVTSGVPQGSHIGPILFLLFINDLAEAVKHCNVLMYADDVKLFLSVKHPIDQQHLQNDLNSFYKWCHFNLMELNLNKCKHMQFSRVNHCAYSYVLGGCNLQSVDSIMDLGILLDAKLTFVQHITMAVNKSRSVLAFIKRWAKEFNDPFITKSLFTSLVRPILEYGCIAWDPIYNTHNDRVESVQKQFLIFCLRNVYRDYLALPSYATRLAEINLPTLKSRRTMHSISFMVNLINGNIHSEFLLNNVNFNIPQRSLRYFNPLYIRICRTNYAMSDPLTKLCNCYNEMYYFIDFSLNINTIKCNVISFLNR